jgi:hypothetical protein
VSDDSDLSLVAESGLGIAIAVLEDQRIVADLNLAKKQESQIEWATAIASSLARHVRKINPGTKHSLSALLEEANSQSLAQDTDEPFTSRAMPKQVPLPDFVGICCSPLVVPLRFPATLDPKNVDDLLAPGYEYFCLQQVSCRMLTLNLTV